jgi:hypothetical protein
MGNAVSTGEIGLLLRILDQAYDKKAWHGPNLKGAIRRLTAAQAAWRPNPKRRSIADITVHCAYWKYAVRRRLRGDKRGSFLLPGSNWFVLQDPLTEADWNQYVRLLEDEHQALRAAAAEVSPNRLHKASAGSKNTNAVLIYGAASHDLYHAGQIQILKRLQT